MSKSKAAALAFGVALIVSLLLAGRRLSLPDLFISPLDGGPLNFRPQLVSSATSPDGKVSVKVFRQRIPSHSRYVGGEMRVYVYDVQGRLIYERMIGQDGAWDELDNAYENIQFEDNLILISQFWGRSHKIDRNELP